MVCPKINEKKPLKFSDCVVNVKIPIPVHKPVEFPIIPCSEIQDNQKVSYLGFDIEEFKKKGGKIVPFSDVRCKY